MKMAVMTVTLCLLAGCWLVVDAAGSDWTYNKNDNTGPKDWASMPGFETCGAKSQSPVDLKDATADSSMGNISLTGYDQTPDGLTMTMANNGHSIGVTVGGAEMTMTGGKLPGTFKLAGFHFHWGADNERGSEHRVDGKAHAMEMHFVHFNTKYATVADADEKEDGLAVLGFFMDISDEDNEAFNHISDYIQNVTYKDDSVVLENFNLSTIIPTDLSHFFRYSGSLTTPPCHESVTWTVFDSNIKISNRQLDLFRETYFNKQGNGTNVAHVDNHRPLQPIYERTITSNFITDGGATIGSNLMMTSFVAVLLLLVHC